jgi:hypothetical protein
MVGGLCRFQKSNLNTHPAKTQKMVRAKRLVWVEEAFRGSTTGAFFSAVRFGAGRKALNPERPPPPKRAFLRGPEDGPRKKARLGGGGLSGFNAFLPAPKRTAEKKALRGPSSVSSPDGCSGLISGIATRILAGLLGSIWNLSFQPRNEQPKRKLQWRQHEKCLVSKQEQALDLIGPLHLHPLDFRRRNHSSSPHQLCDQIQGLLLF